MQMKAKTRAPRALLAYGVAIAALTAGHAWAQGTVPGGGRNPAPETRAASNEATAVEEVVVTGSSIRGVAPVGSALIGVTREAIEATAPTNVKEVLQTVPALGNFNTNAEQSTPNRFRTQGFLPNIHNLGIYATLTLLNGHRVANTGTEGTFPDPSTVPPIAIARTEIIADGASAIYGSDATAGVVNFIYRKPFNGVEAQATYSWDGETRYRRRDFGIIGGHLWDGGGAVLAYEYSDNRSPLNTEIPFLALGGDQSSRGGRDTRGNGNCPTPTMRAVLANGVPTGPTYGAASLNFTTNSVAQRCGLLSPSLIINDGKRHASLFTIEHQVNETVKLWGEFNYGHYVGYSIGGANQLTFLVPRTNPFFTPQNVAPALYNNPAVTRISVSRNGLGLFPERGYGLSGTSTVATAVVGMDIDLGNDWKGTLSLDVSRTRDTNGSPGSQYDELNAIAALNDTNPATAFNIFGTAAQNNPATLARIDNDTYQANWGQQGLQELQFKADGPLYTIPGGEIRAAFGAAFRASQANERQLAGSRNPNAGYDAIARDDHPRQQVSAAFFEFNVPLVSSANAKPFVEELTLSISGRYDNYDKYGGTFNPKYGFVYAPIQGLRFHGSYGTNFNAPNVGLLTGLFGQPSYNRNTNQVIGYGPFKGTLLNNINQYVLSGQGGGNLTPERAKTKSFGVDYAPYGFLDGLRVGVNWYKVNYTNLFFKITGSDLITNPLFSAYAEFFPTPERMAEIIRLYPPSSAIIVSNFEYVPHTEAVNLGTRIYEGIDYDISYSHMTGLGRFNAGVSANQQLKFDQQVLAGAPFESRVGTQDAVKWKARFNVGWSLDAISANVFVNHTGSYTNTTSVIVKDQKVKAFTTVDATVAYQFKNLLNGVTLQGRVQNLFDKDPPFYDSGNGYNGGLASPFPRSFDVTLRAKF